MFKLKTRRSIICIKYQHALKNELGLTRLWGTTVNMILVKCVLCLSQIYLINCSNTIEVFCFYHHYTRFNYGELKVINKLILPIKLHFYLL